MDREGKPDHGLHVRGGRLNHGNRSGDPQLAPRCGARRRKGGLCRAPAMRGKRRCRLHGGLSTGPNTLAGVARLRAARTRHGRFSAEGLAVSRWQRRYVSNGYRSIRALVRELGEGRINGRDARHYLESMLATEERDGIAPALLEEQRREARTAVLAHDAERLRAKGFL